MHRLLLLTALACALAAQSLQHDVERILAASSVARRAFWGIHVVDARDGRTLYERNADSLFVPASNAKLFCGALALMRLGPDHRFQTLMLADQSPDAEGRMRGDLHLVGGGDPTLSGRAIPYRKGPNTGDPLQAIEELAGQAIARGLRRIDGDIVGDDTAYLWEPYPSGWAIDDAVWEYGAPVSALTLNDNAFSLTIRPGAGPGEPARLSLRPSLEYYVIDNRVRTTPAGVEGKIEVDRPGGSRQLRLWGALPQNSRGVSFLLAIDDPALYAAHALRDALTRRGVWVGGRAVALHRFPNQAPPDQGRGVELARRTSPPLIESLRIMQKVSQNLQAELCLREVARVRRGAGSRQAGLEELKAFLAEIGVEPESCQFEDGSGLSRLTLVAPRTVTRLLQHLYRSEHRDAWLSLLPVGGDDGTLGYRFEGAPEARRILAKTGTISHVGALSGYAEGPAGRLLFSILVNNYKAPSSEIRKLIDAIALRLVRQASPRSP